MSNKQSIEGRPAGLDQLLPAIMEAVRAEIHTQLQVIVPMIEQDLKEVANILNANLNDLLKRVEELEGASEVPAQSPRIEGKEL